MVDAIRMISPPFIFLCSFTFSPYSILYFISLHTRFSIRISENLYTIQIMNNEVFAAIAMALHDDLGYNLHDDESGKLTIRNHNTEWTSKVIKMTGATL